MAARASCSTPAQFSRRMRVRARLEKKVGSLGFLRILFVVDIQWLVYAWYLVEVWVLAG